MKRIFQTTPLQFCCFPSTYLDLSSHTLAYFPLHATLSPSSSAHTLSGIYWPWQLLPLHVQKPPEGFLGILLQQLIGFQHSISHGRPGLQLLRSTISQYNPQKDAVVCCHEQGSVEERAAAQPTCTSEALQQWQVTSCRAVTERTPNHTTANRH